MAPKTPRVIYIAAAVLLALLSTGSVQAAFPGMAPGGAFAPMTRPKLRDTYPAFLSQPDLFRPRPVTGAAEALLKRRIISERLYQAAA